MKHVDDIKSIRRYELIGRNIRVGDYQIYASYFGPTAKTALLLHGGGNSSSTRIHPLREDLAERGIGTLAVDHLGHGKTGGDIGQSSLKKRVDDVLAALDFFKPTQILGSVSMSMGGHISLKLHEILQSESMVLIAPAVYSSSAYEAQFFSGFTEIIRKPESWRESDVWRILEDYSGRLLTLIGKDDKAIPYEVFELILSSAKKADHQFIELQGVDHFVMTRLRQGDPDKLARILDIISTTLSGNRKGHPQSEQCNQQAI